MSELFREIEEDIRRERFEKLWHSFGKIMIGVSLAVILVTVIVVVVHNHKQSVAMEQTAQFIKGIDRIKVEDYKGAIDAFDQLAADPSSPYYGIAMLRMAQAQSALGGPDAAAETYKDLAAHDPVLGGLAELLLAQNGKADVKFSGQKASAFYYTQSEWHGWDLLKQGKKDEAVTQFLTLYENPAVPHSMHDRMQEALQHLAPEKLMAKAEPVNAKDVIHDE